MPKVTQINVVEHKEFVIFETAHFLEEKEIWRKTMPDGLSKRALNYH